MSSEMNKNKLREAEKSNREGGGGSTGTVCVGGAGARGVTRGFYRWKQIIHNNVTHQSRFRNNSTAKKTF